MGSVAKITLDAETFRALASSTRLTVLRALDVRRKTLTELAKDLALNKATVHEHLQILTQSGLVAKKDEGRKWIYYELTWRGQKILHPQETTTFSVLLGLGVIAAGGGVAMLGRALDFWLQEHPLLDPTTDPASDPTQDGNERVGLAMDQSTSGTSTAAAPAAGSGTASSSAPPQTSTGAQSATGTYSDHDASSSAAQGFAAETTTSPPESPPDTDAGFFDEGGWLAIALLAFSALAVTLAALLRRRLRPAPFVPPAGPETETP
ncbi:MAG: hypothetical protein QOD77_54 [Thermoplasmata archaeon]|jgi:DNA-binding transcriptional ArsR family regulator|nr:hypothetical protein [Thermoplasmata archaeon]